jgi:hypothetical protein
MKPRLSLRWMALLAAMTFITMTCNLVASPQQPVPTQTDITETSLPNSTNTPQPVVTSTASVISPTDTGPRCTVLQELNFRFGPGVAYDPPIGKLQQNAVVIPVGYNPLGTPGGSWAMVRAPSTNQQGWVNADAQYIACNINLTSLPPVAVAPPPKPDFPQSVLSSIPDGNGFCIDPDSGYQCIVTFSDESLIQFQLKQAGRELNQTDGIEQVDFSIRTFDGDNPFYEITEVTSAYCLFGGNGPCNGWVVENGVYKWSPGGIPVQEGVYHVQIDVVLNGEFSTWKADFTISLP